MLGAVTTQVTTATLLDWLQGTGVWVLLTVALGLGVVLLTRRLVKHWVARTRERLDTVTQLPVLGWAWVGVGRLLELAIYLLVAGGTVLGVLWALDVDVAPALEVLRQAGLAMGNWARTHGVRLLLILGLAVLLYRLLTTVGRRSLEPLLLHSISKPGTDPDEARKRARTITDVLVGTGRVLVVLVAVLMGLPELNLNIGPLLAGVGIAGLALGFGAQHLVRDLISGMFILLEDQYRKGDVVRIAGIAGLVEEVNLRRTILRDLDGIVHIIPNGEVTTSSNFTKDFSRINLNIPVAYKEDLDKVFRVLNRVGRELAEDPYYGHLILEAPQVLRVDDFQDSGIAIKMLGVTKPIRQWEVAGELRRRIKKAFDEEGIEIPFPHLTLYWGQGASPWDSAALLAKLAENRPQTPAQEPAPSGSPRGTAEARLPDQEQS